MSVRLTWREVRTWPGAPTGTRAKAPFKKANARLLDELDRELWKLSVTSATLSGYFRVQDFRRDGSVYADARPSAPGVILEYDRSGSHFRFACDRFTYWLDNLDAIVRSLEALRMIDRYGVTSGQQYEGFKAIPERATEALTTTQALEVIRQHSGNGISAADLSRDPEALVRALRLAKNRTHPDTEGGSHAAFLEVQAAEKILLAGASRG